MKSFFTAWGLFTILPAPVVENIDRPLARRAMLAFPWVGLVLGVLGAAGAGVVLWCGGGALLAGIVGLLIITAATGAMHLDGIADTFDGLGSRKSPKEALAVMKKSDIGPMGVAALVLVVLVDIAALASPRLATGWAIPMALALAPMVGRLADVEATGTWVPCARAGGFGSLFAGIIRPYEWALELLAVTALAGGAGFLAGDARGAIVASAAVAIATLIGWLWRRHVVKRLGGITGDILGSIIEFSQTAFLLVLALAW